MIAFSDAELRDLFTLSIKTDGCQTRKLIPPRASRDKLTYRRLARV